MWELECLIALGCSHYNWLKCYLDWGLSSTWLKCLRDKRNQRSRQRSCSNRVIQIPSREADLQFLPGPDKLTHCILGGETPSLCPLQMYTSHIHTFNSKLSLKADGSQRLSHFNTSPKFRLAAESLLLQHLVTTHYSHLILGCWLDMVSLLSPTLGKIFPSLFFKKKIFKLHCRSLATWFLWSSSFKETKQ